MLLLIQKNREKCEKGEKITSHFLFANQYQIFKLGELFKTLLMSLIKLKMFTLFNISIRVVHSEPVILSVRIAVPVNL